MSLIWTSVFKNVYMDNPPQHESRLGSGLYKYKMFDLIWSNLTRTDLNHYSLNMFIISYYYKMSGGSSQVGIVRVWFMCKVKCAGSSFSKHA